MSYRETDPKRWEDFGYPANEQKCDICDASGDCKMEPRFPYVTCRDHARVAPIHRREMRGQR